jgi:hypothetical protein
MRTQKSAMKRISRRQTVVALLGAALLGVAFIAYDRTTSDQAVGSYQIVCQPRTEFYFSDEPAGARKRQYLGTCGTPGLIRDALHVSGDESCYAVSEDGRSMVYLHLPLNCGAPKKGEQNIGGLYRHTALEGDRLLYRYDDEVDQVWGGSDVGAHAMRVVWRGSGPSRSGARCGQHLVIAADGQETAEGQADATDPICQLLGKVK